MTMNVKTALYPRHTFTPAELPQVDVVQAVVIEPAMLQLIRPRLRAHRIVRKMLKEIDNFVDRPQLQ
jgi:hypothetical protein